MGGIQGSLRKRENAIPRQSRRQVGSPEQRVDPRPVFELTYGPGRNQGVPEAEALYVEVGRQRVLPQELAACLEPEEDAQIAAAAGDISRGIAQAWHLPIDHPDQATAAPEQVARPIVAVYQYTQRARPGDEWPRRARCSPYRTLQPVGVGSFERGQIALDAFRLFGQKCQLIDRQAVQTNQHLGCLRDVC